MFGKSWDGFWKSFDDLMSKLPGVIDEAARCGCTKLTLKDGNIEIRGKFKSLRINGKLIRLPKEVFEK